MTDRNAETDFASFETRQIPTSRGAVHARVRGNGPPVLLLHGYPQSHLMWRDVAPLLADRHTVVATDLAGYGESFRPAPAEDHAPHGKRALAQDQVEAMAALGFDRFAVAGHDRGGRVAYRMALDHPDRVERLAVLDIVPTGEVWARADRGFARGYWHWAFLSLPAPLPERLIAGDPQAYFDHHVRAGMGLGREPGRYPDAVMDAYRRAFDDPGAIEAFCEDYRAGATVDVEHDDAARAAGRQIGCPVLALWAARGALPLFYPDVLDVWRPWAPDLRGQAIDASHFLVEDRPQETADALVTFLADPAPPSVTDDRERSRLELRVRGELAGWLDYRPAGGSIIVAHTEVMEGHEGEGLGGLLVRSALDAARAAGKTVIPTCPFASAYIDRHPELDEFLAPQARRRRSEDA